MKAFIKITKREEEKVNISRIIIKLPSEEVLAERGGNFCYLDLSAINKKESEKMKNINYAGCK
jgi:hypothetical protein